MAWLTVQATVVDVAFWRIGATGAVKAMSSGPLGPGAGSKSGSGDGTAAASAAAASTSPDP